MSKNVKILILVLTILPIVLFFGGYIGMIVCMFGSVASAAAGAANKGGIPDFAAPFAGMAVMFICMGAAQVLALGIFVFYLCNLIVTNRVPRDLRPVWGVLIFIGYWIAWIVYWYCYIWREPVTASEVTTVLPSPPAETAGPEG